MSWAVQYYSGDFILYNIVILWRLDIVKYSVFTLDSTVLLWRLYLVQYSYLMETWYCKVQCLYLGQYSTTLGTLSCTIQLSYGDLILYSTVIFWRPNIVQYSVVFTLGSTVLLWRLYLVQYSYLLETWYCTVQYYSGDFLEQYSYLMETWYCTVQCLYLGQYSTTLETLSYTI